MSTIFDHSLILYSVSVILLFHTRIESTGKKCIVHLPWLQKIELNTMHIIIIFVLVNIRKHLYLRIIRNSTYIALTAVHINIHVTQKYARMPNFIQYIHVVSLSLLGMKKAIIILEEKKKST